MGTGLRRRSVSVTIIELPVAHPMQMSAWRAAASSTWSGSNPDQAGPQQGVARDEERAREVLEGGVGEGAPLAVIGEQAGEVAAEPAAQVGADDPGEVAGGVAVELDDAAGRQVDREPEIELVDHRGLAVGRRQQVAPRTSTATRPASKSGQPLSTVVVRRTDPVRRAGVDSTGRWGPGAGWSA